MLFLREIKISPYTTHGSNKQLIRCLYKEKRKHGKSQSTSNFICVQTSYMFRLYIAIIRLNIALQIRMQYNCRGEIWSYINIQLYKFV
jgi:hypothetical protein